MRIGLIAGSGQFPIIFCERAREHGLEVYAVAYLNEADPSLAAYVQEMVWLPLGKISRLIQFFKKHEIDAVVMMGAIRKTSLFKDLKPDMKALAMLAGMRHTHDDGVLRAFADCLQKNGIQVKPSTYLLPDLLAEPGCWTQRRPSRSEKADIRLGWTLAKEIGRLDIGQCVVVGGGSILAVEAVDGTDATIRRGGQLGQGNAVVVKVCKPIQDERFDVPAVGAQTIQSMRESNTRLLALEAGKAVVFDRDAMISAADEAGICIVAIEDIEAL
jgi:UDP-2,3-diacylglucosamine hydrolase